jgi:hypothetical protein
VFDMGEQTAVADEHAVNIENERLERHLVSQGVIVLKPRDHENIVWLSMSPSWFLMQFCQRARLPVPLVTISSVPTTMLFYQAVESSYQREFPSPCQDS